jgi:hypothetical protein
MVSDFRHTHPLRGLRPFFIVAMAGLWILFPAAFDAVAQQTLHHELEVEILHDAKTLRGIDTIRLPGGGRACGWPFDRVCASLTWKAPPTRTERVCCI